MPGMLTHDLRAAARTLRRNRGFAASAIAILAIGIAASTGLFAVVDAVVLHPLPYAGADRLARVQLLPPSGPVRRASVTADEFRALRQALTLDAAYIRESFTKTLCVACYSIAHRTREFGIRRKYSHRSTLRYEPLSRRSSFCWRTNRPTASRSSRSSDEDAKKMRIVRGGNVTWPVAILECGRVRNEERAETCRQAPPLK